jgi:hypothetical protein
MNNFWETAIKPILAAAKPEVVVEIGVYSGVNTRNILDFCGDETVLHAIDPAPIFDVGSLIKDYQERLVFHLDTSMNVIPRLPQFQVGIVDGDHNWYTVYNELRAILELHGGDARRFPLLLLHDIAWPYGRRDLYYDPQRIPDEFRNEYAQKGIRWGQSELADDGGLNSQLMNAVREGGARNGVLTAIEDFIEQSPIEFDFIRIPAYFGLGILVAEERKAESPALAEVLDEIAGTGGLSKIMESLEQIRAKANIQQQELIRERNALRQRQEAAASNFTGTVSRDRLPTLSIIVVVYNMRREARRTLYSLSRKYQKEIEDLNYEVIVVDNGSSEPLGKEFVREFGENFSYLYLEEAPASPARAINVGAQRARGEVLAIMIDGAHVLTPKILYYAMWAFQIHSNPIVAPRYWFTGPGQQGETVRDGYGPEEEDQLFEQIGWPSDGYRLFEIGEFIGPNHSWLSGFFESNCLFMRKDVFDAIGGANERFAFPGGGFLNLDLMREASEHEGVTLVTFLGEATFHQVHGGITTNVPPELREERVAMYRKQYREIRGREYQVPDQKVEYLGHRPNFERQRLAFKDT